MNSQDFSANSSDLYKRLLGYAFAYKGFFFLSLFGFLAYAAMEASLAMTVEFFVDALQKKPSESLQFLPSVIIESVYFIPLTIIILTVIRGIGAFLGNFYISRVGINVVNDLRKALFSHMMYLPQEFYDHNDSGKLISLIIYNISQVTGSVTSAIKIIFRDGLTLIGFLAVMFYHNWKLTLIFFAIAPVLAIIIYVASRYFRKVSHKIQSTAGDVTHIATESIQGIQVVKSFSGEDYENRRFNAATDNNLKYNTKYERVNAIQAPILHLTVACALAVIFLLILLFWDKSAGAAVAYVTAAGLIAKPFKQLSTVNSIIQRGLAAAESIFDTLDLAKEQNSGSTKLERIKGQIEFKNVSFHYNNKQRALHNINLTIKPGDTVALVGPSGSGKTTIANLLMRLYTPTQGDIFIDGVPIQEATIDSLRQHIGLVNQHTILFNDSIKNNITYGRYQASDKDTLPAIERAAKHAFAYDFIQQLEAGFDTPAGEGGARLSGGQKQRIAIARALFKNAPILILDEATAALDNESEKQIQLALEKLKEGRTTLVIAHRLSTIESADAIVVLQEGQIVETGTHSDLLAKNGLYTGLYNSQFAE